ncbi:hypothetical protein EW026_g6249 [Hermanssonia centrifuga]|uniref:Cytochrome P450 n=1 Tax=Hermanssonia centrifuga TaxID=98765 RepID=A0A4S4KBK4_9APHY|nr:hypothetical protein EW026_g6249 [Hermanssonia centrifuga]
MATTFLVTSITLLLVALKKYLDYREAVKSVQNHPGFRTLFSSFGVLNQILFRVPIPGVSVGSFRHWRAKHADFEYFGVDIISHVNPAAAKEITAHRARFPKPVEYYGALSFFGRNIVASEGEEWKRYRKVTAPAFSEPNNKLVWDETDSLHHVSTDIVLKILCPDWFLQYAPIKRLNTCKLAYDELEVFLPQLLFIRAEADTKRLKKFMLDMVASRRNAEKKEDRYDLFSSLLDASEDEMDGGGKLTDRELLGWPSHCYDATHTDGLRTQGISSYSYLQTTAHTLCFTFALLAIYQEEQEILYQHIKSVLTDDRLPKYEDMNKLTQSTAVFYETLRMYPPVTEIPKVSAEDTALTTQNSAGETVIVPIPQGTSITLHVAGVHYNPRYWDDPTAFKPARFLSDWPRDAFLPFSGGARACLGRRFFETEGIAILTMLISKYKIEIKDEPEFAAESFEEKKARILQGRQGLTLTPVHMPLVFKRR